MREKKLRAAGVSNFNLDQMKQLLEVAQVKPALLQSNSGGSRGGCGLGTIVAGGCRLGNGGAK
jgi:hypothetical protein